MLFSIPQVSEACTAVIISGKVTSDGRPLLWKHRDTDNTDNSIRHFTGEKYSFTGLVDSGSSGGEIWIGVNTAGFAVMNTASYCLKNDDVPASMMDREGILMYRALEICATLDDFEYFLDTLSRPMGVEANFGCIDAHGGAAWYETDNDSYFKRDVNESGDGFIAVTNFSVSGDSSRWKGVERYMTAVDIFGEMNEKGEIADIHPLDIVDNLSRSYKHSFMGIDLGSCPDCFPGKSGGVFPDQDFIPRKSTAASVVVHGVSSGGDPLGTVLWAALGYPSVSVTVPVPLSDSDHVPASLSSSGKSRLDTFGGLSIYLKDRYVFPYPDVSNFSEYVCLEYVLSGKDCGPSLISCCRNAESDISSMFCKLYDDYCSGSISYRAYLRKYDRIASGFMDVYSRAFSSYTL